MTPEEIAAEVDKAYGQKSAPPSAGGKPAAVSKGSISDMVDQVYGGSSSPAPADGTAPQHEGFLESIAKDAASISQSIGIARDPAAFARIAAAIKTLPPGHPLRIQAENQLQSLGRAAAVGG